MNTATAAIAPTKQSDHSTREGGSIVAPPGFRPATAKDFTDRPDGWVGPTIYGSRLVDGRFETVGIARWTPDEGVVRVLNSNLYSTVDAAGAAEVFDRLDDMLNYAALEAETTSPSELARAYRECPDVFSWAGAPWEQEEAAHSTLVEEVMSVHDVVAAGAPIGIFVDVTLDEFARLGLDMNVEYDTLQLAGTKEEIARAAALFTEMGAKLSAFLGGQPA